MDKSNKDNGRYLKITVDDIRGTGNPSQDFKHPGYSFKYNVCSKVDGVDTTSDAVPSPRELFEVLAGIISKMLPLIVEEISLESAVDLRSSLVTVIDSVLTKAMRPQLEGHILSKVEDLLKRGNNDEEEGIRVSDTLETDAVVVVSPEGVSTSIGGNCNEELIDKIAEVYTASIGPNTVKN